MAEAIRLISFPVALLYTAATCLKTKIVWWDIFNWQFFFSVIRMVGSFPFILPKCSQNIHTYTVDGTSMSINTIKWVFSLFWVGCTVIQLALQAINLVD